MKKIYRIPTAKAKNAKTLRKGAVRITILASALVRVEWSESQDFADEPSQKVWNRSFAQPFFAQKQCGNETILETEKLVISLREGATLRDSVEIRLKKPADALHKSWRDGDKLQTLKGTARTLDNADGAIELEDGILSRQGISVLDDSESYLINEDGTLTARADKNAKDLYVFGYGHDYRACLSDFLKLTGNPPLLPRWALGNWWSRYHRYTQKEYLSLMEEFAKKQIPLSVAMIDMDWHITQIDPAIGSGWTGYTWNRELIPNPDEFLEELHKKQLKVSLNVHPAEGGGRHEEAYNAIRRELGLEKDGETVPFDITNPAFVEAYFKCLHEPLEAQGVDFWWIDWQQGETTRLPGLDPLWILNHYHYLDNAKDGKRPLILSRYAGPGSHRYPVGFSGDTVISWKSLRFQPYFTATASNIGYGWWSHDIGGHMLGSYDEELQVRWVQFGVFSPIMRLHSSSSEFNHKEPWKLGRAESEIITRYLRLRHQLIPYLYTMNVRFSAEGRTPIEPMYYEFPEEADAYTVPNEYFFGTELIASPVTEQLDSKLQLAPVQVWLPEGTYTDICTGMSYEGKKKITLYRSLAEIPMLLKAGGILPLASEKCIETAATSLPESFDVYVATGACGTFSLYEDDGESQLHNDGKTSVTVFDISDDGTFTIHAATGNTSLLPKERVYHLHFLNCDEVKSAILEGIGELSPADYCYDPMRRELSLCVRVSVNEEKKLLLDTKKSAKSCKELALKRCFALLDKARLDFIKKEQIYAIIKANPDAASVAEQLLSRGEDGHLINALLERLSNI